MKIVEVLGLKEDASDGAITSGVFASLSFPMFTGKRGSQHYATARGAVDPMGKIFKGKKKKQAPYKMGYSSDTLAYRTKIKDIYEGPSVQQGAQMLKTKVGGRASGAQVSKALDRASGGDTLNPNMVKFIQPYAGILQQILGNQKLRQKFVQMIRQIEQDAKQTQSTAPTQPTAPTNDVQQQL
tara:strand:- start:1069 stop:1617 length:549 start_codon:yes stop_codon:yes gene_type:complete